MKVKTNVALIEWCFLGYILPPVGYALARLNCNGVNCPPVWACYSVA